MAKNYEELTAGLDRTKLPATRVAEDALTLFPEAGVGDEVVVHSRGYYRMALVLESTPKRVMVAYTTEGAWNEAMKIAETYLAPGHLENSLKNVADSASKNYDYYVRTATPEDAAAQLAKWSYMTPESVERDRLHAVERLAGMGTKEEHVEAEVASRRARLEQQIALAKEKGAAAFVNVTTKSVKRTEVYCLAKAAV